MEFKYVLIIIIIILAIIFLYNKQENIDSLSNEAIQNIASVYNTQNMQVTKINVTDSITTPKITTPKIYSPNGNYYLSMQDDGNFVLYDANTKPHFDTKQTLLDITSLKSALNDIKSASVRTDKEYAIQSSRNSYLKDAGGWSIQSNIDDPSHPWERMRFKEMKTKLNSGDYHWN